eukprot:958523-Ditylum_brightwellii.AAC.1
MDNYHSKHHHPINQQQQQVQYVMNAAIAAEYKDVVENICNVMRCMRAVVQNQVSVQGCAEALPRLNKCDTWIGANTTARTTAKW